MTGAFTGYAFFARRRERSMRIDAAIAALERSAAAAEAERVRLAEAVDLTHRALRLLHDQLCDWAGQPARAASATARLEGVATAADAHARQLIESAQADLRVAANAVASAASERVAAELAPAREAAQAHAAFLRDSLARMRGEAAALSGAQEAAAALVTLSTAAGADLLATVDALARRSNQTGDAAERAAGRLVCIADRLEASASAQRGRSR